MDKKNKIYTGVIVVAFALTAYILYSNFSTKKTPPSPGALPVPLASFGATPAPANILPFGNKFDTSILKQLNTQFNVFKYPSVNSSDVGVQTSDLIKTQSESPK